MRINSQKENIHLDRKLEELNIDAISKRTQFSKRKPRKIVPKALIMGFFLMVFSPGRNSFTNWAMKIGFIIGKKVSKQGLWKRADDRLVNFLKALLEKAMIKVLGRDKNINIDTRLKRFNNILLQDSTHIKLDENLEKYYPGNENMFRDKKKSVMKIHSIYNLSKESFSKLYISSFRKNDQKASQDILQVAQKGDLIIRDLGYFVLRIFRGLSRQGIYYISKLHRGVKVLSNKDEMPIDLVKLLKRRDIIDEDVLLGLKEKVSTRIIAVPLEESVVSERRRKAKNNRDRRLNPSKDGLFLMGWAIMITNLERDQYSMKDIFKIYRLRWKIEIIFKSWKSHLGIRKIEELDNRIKAETYIYSMLLFITLFQLVYYKYIFFNMSRENSGKERYISLLKLTEFINGNLLLIIMSAIIKTNQLEWLITDFIKYYCLYETRKDRRNYYERLNELS